jgi:hypothetical protein
MSFEALTAGSSTVQVFNLIALDSLGLGLTTTTSSSTVRVTGPVGTPEPGTWLLLGVGNPLAHPIWLGSGRLPVAVAG